MPTDHAVVFQLGCRYHKCVGEVLKDSDQDCSGVCTPARRHHKIVNFEWDAECRLKRSIDSGCIDYVQLYCFSDMKVSQGSRFLKNVLSFLSLEFTILQLS